MAGRKMDRPHEGLPRPRGGVGWGACALSFLALLSLAACAASPSPGPEHSRVPAATPEAVRDGDADEPGVAAEVFGVGTERFYFRSSPRVGLMHFLRAWAMAEAGEWPPYGSPIYERSAWPLPAGEDGRMWVEAVEAFSSTVDRSLVFNGGLISLRRWASGERGRDAVAPADRPLVDVMERVLPVYLRHFWPSHDLRNRAFIASVLPAIRDVEEDVAVHIERAYGGAWPDRQIPIEVVAHANALGAYSTAGRVVIAAADASHQMPQATEILFHEASHVDGLEGPLRRAIEAAWREAGGGEPPDRLWHDFIFYTTGEATRLALTARGYPDYRHYGAFGLYRRGERWDTELPAFEAHWRPFMEGAARPGGPAPGPARRAALTSFARQIAAQ